MMVNHDVFYKLDLFISQKVKKLFIIVLLFLGCERLGFAQKYQLQINWHKIITVSNTTATMQVVNCPLLRRNSALHNILFKEIKALQANYVRYIPYFIYPKMAVPELDPPANKNTSWDFSIIDPIIVDYMKAANGHPFVLNFSTIPQWMFNADKPMPYPANPNDFSWPYGFGGGTVLRDTTMRELSDYFARIISWYHRGGFTDESGTYHKSGHDYTIPYWEVFNEPDGEHQHTPESYTKRYDAIVTAIKKVSPKTKFVGMAIVSYWSREWFEYFLNPANHKPGVPLDMISYHCYAGPTDKNAKLADNLNQYFE
jgi:hypothetical protein